MLNNINHITITITNHVIVYPIIIITCFSDSTMRYFIIHFYINSNFRSGILPITCIAGGTRPNIITLTILTMV